MYSLRAALLYIITLEIENTVLCGICLSRFLISLIRGEEAKPRARCNPWAAPVQLCVAGAAALGGERTRHKRSISDIPRRSWHGSPLRPFLWRLCSPAVSMVLPLCVQTCVQAALFSIPPHRLISRGGASHCVPVLQSCQASATQTSCSLAHWQTFGKHGLMVFNRIE